MPLHYEIQCDDRASLLIEKITKIKTRKSNSYQRQSHLQHQQRYDPDPIQSLPTSPSPPNFTPINILTNTVDSSPLQHPETTTVVITGDNSSSSVTYSVRPPISTSSTQELSPSPVIPILSTPSSRRQPLYPGTRTTISNSTSSTLSLTTSSTSTDFVSLSLLTGNDLDPLSLHSPSLIFSDGTPSSCFRTGLPHLHHHLSNNFDPISALPSEPSPSINFTPIIAPIITPAKKFVGIPIEDNDHFHAFYYETRALYTNHKLPMIHKFHLLWFLFNNKFSFGQLVHLIHKGVEEKLFLSNHKKGANGHDNMFRNIIPQKHDNISETPQFSLRQCHTLPHTILSHNLGANLRLKRGQNIFSSLFLEGIMKASVNNELHDTASISSQQTQLNCFSAPRARMQKKQRTIHPNLQSTNNDGNNPGDNYAYYRDNELDYIPFTDTNQLLTDQSYWSSKQADTKISNHQHPQTSSSHSNSNYHSTHNNAYNCNNNGDINSSLDNEDEPLLIGLLATYPINMLYVSTLLYFNTYTTSISSHHGVNLDTLPRFSSQRLRSSRKSSMVEQGSLLSSGVLQKTQSDSLYDAANDSYRLCPSHINPHKAIQPYSPTIENLSGYKRNQFGNFPSAPTVTTNHASLATGLSQSSNLDLAVAHPNHQSNSPTNALYSDVLTPSPLHSPIMQMQGGNIPYNNPDNSCDEVFSIPNMKTDHSTRLVLPPFPPDGLELDLSNVDTPLHKHCEVTNSENSGQNNHNYYHNGNIYRLQTQISGPTEALKTHLPCDSLSNNSHTLETRINHNNNYPFHSNNDNENDEIDGSAFGEDLEDGYVPITIHTINENDLFCVLSYLLQPQQVLPRSFIYQDALNSQISDHATQTTKKQEKTCVLTSFTNQFMTYVISLVDYSYLFRAKLIFTLIHYAPRTVFPPKSAIFLNIFQYISRPYMYYAYNDLITVYPPLKTMLGVEQVIFTQQLKYLEHLEKKKQHLMKLQSNFHITTISEESQRSGPMIHQYRSGGDNLMKSQTYNNASPPNHFKAMTYHHINNHGNAQIVAPFDFFLPDMDSDNQSSPLEVHDSIIAPVQSLPYGAQDNDNMTQYLRSETHWKSQNLNNNTSPMKSIFFHATNDNNIHDSFQHTENFKMSSESLNSTHNDENDLIHFRPAVSIISKPIFVKPFLNRNINGPDTPQKSSYIQNVMCSRNLSTVTYPTSPLTSEPSKPFNSHLALTPTIVLPSESRTSSEQHSIFFTHNSNSSITINVPSGDEQKGRVVSQVYTEINFEDQNEPIIEHHRRLGSSKSIEELTMTSLESLLKTSPLLQNNKSGLVDQHRIAIDCIRAREYTAWQEQTNLILQKYSGDQNAAKPHLPPPPALSKPLRTILDSSELDELTKKTYRQEYYNYNPIKHNEHVLTFQFLSSDYTAYFASHRQVGSSPIGKLFTETLEDKIDRQRIHTNFDGDLAEQILIFHQKAYQVYDYDIFRLDSDPQYPSRPKSLLLFQFHILKRAICAETSFIKPDIDALREEQIRDYIYEMEGRIPRNFFNEQYLTLINQYSVGHYDEDFVPGTSFKVKKPLIPLTREELAQIYDFRLELEQIEGVRQAHYVELWNFTNNVKQNTYNGLYNQYLIDTSMLPCIRSILFPLQSPRWPPQHPTCQPPPIAPISRPFNSFSPHHALDIPENPSSTNIHSLPPISSPIIFAKTNTLSNNYSRVLDRATSSTLRIPQTSSLTSTCAPNNSNLSNIVNTSKPSQPTRLSIHPSMYNTKSHIHTQHPISFQDRLYLPHLHHMLHPQNIPLIGHTINIIQLLLHTIFPIGILSHFSTLCPQRFVQDDKSFFQSPVSREELNHALAMTIKTIQNTESKLETPAPCPNVILVDRNSCHPRKRSQSQDSITLGPSLSPRSNRMNHQRRSSFSGDTTQTPSPSGQHLVPHCDIKVSNRPNNEHLKEGCTETFSPLSPTILTTSPLLQSPEINCNHSNTPTPSKLEIKRYKPKRHGEYHGPTRSQNLGNALECRHLPLAQRILHQKTGFVTPPSHFISSHNPQNDNTTLLLKGSVNIRLANNILSDGETKSPKIFLSPFYMCKNKNINQNYNIPDDTIPELLSHHPQRQWMPQYSPHDSSDVSSLSTTMLSSSSVRSARSIRSSFSQILNGSVFSQTLVTFLQHESSVDEFIEILISLMNSISLSFCTIEILDYLYLDIISPLAAQFLILLDHYHKLQQNIQNNISSIRKPGQKKPKVVKNSQKSIHAILNNDADSTNSAHPQPPHTHLSSQSFFSPSLSYPHENPLLPQSLMKPLNNLKTLDPGPSGDISDTFSRSTTSTPSNVPIDPPQQSEQTYTVECDSGFLQPFNSNKPIHAPSIPLNRHTHVIWSPFKPQRNGSLSYSSSHSSHMHLVSSSLSTDAVILGRDGVDSNITSNSSESTDPLSIFLTSSTTGRNFGKMAHLTGQNSPNTLNSTLENNHESNLVQTSTRLSSHKPKAQLSYHKHRVQLVFLLLTFVMRNYIGRRDIAPYLTNIRTLDPEIYDAIIAQYSPILFSALVSGIAMQCARITQEPTNDYLILKCVTALASVCLYDDNRNIASARSIDLNLNKTLVSYIQSHCFFEEMPSFAFVNSSITHLFHHLKLPFGDIKAIMYALFSQYYIPPFDLSSSSFYNLHNFNYYPQYQHHAFILYNYMHQAYAFREFALHAKRAGVLIELAVRYDKRYHDLQLYDYHLMHGNSANSKVNNGTPRPTCLRPKPLHATITDKKKYFDSSCMTPNSALAAFQRDLKYCGSTLELIIREIILNPMNSAISPLNGLICPMIIALINSESMHPHKCYNVYPVHYPQYIPDFMEDFEWDNPDTPQNFPVPFWIPDPDLRKYHTPPMTSLIVDGENEARRFQRYVCTPSDTNNFNFPDDPRADISFSSSINLYKDHPTGPIKPIAGLTSLFYSISYLAVKFPYSGYPQCVSHLLKLTRPPHLYVNEAVRLTIVESLMLLMSSCNTFILVLRWPHLSAWVQYTQTVSQHLRRAEETLRFFWGFNFLISKLTDPQFAAFIKQFYPKQSQHFSLYIGATKLNSFPRFTRAQCKLTVYDLLDSHYRNLITHECSSLPANPDQNNKDHQRHSLRMIPEQSYDDKSPHISTKGHETLHRERLKNDDINLIYHIRKAIRPNFPLLRTKQKLRPLIPQHKSTPVPNKWLQINNVHVSAQSVQNSNNSSTDSIGIDSFGDHSLKSKKRLKASGTAFAERCQVGVNYGVPQHFHKHLVLNKRTYNRSPRFLTPTALPNAESPQEVTWTDQPLQQSGESQYGPNNKTIQDTMNQYNSISRLAQHQVRRKLYRYVRLEIAPFPLYHITEPPNTPLDFSQEPFHMCKFNQYYSTPSIQMISDKEALFYRTLQSLLSGGQIFQRITADLGTTSLQNRYPANQLQIDPCYNPQNLTDIPIHCFFPFFNRTQHLISPPTHEQYTIRSHTLASLRGYQPNVILLMYAPNAPPQHHTILSLSQISPMMKIISAECITTVPHLLFQTNKGRVYPQQFIYTPSINPYQPRLPTHQQSPHDLCSYIQTQFPILSAAFKGEDLLLQQNASLQATCSGTSTKQALHYDSNTPSWGRFAEFFFPYRHSKIPQASIYSQIINLIPIDTNDFSHTHLYFIIFALITSSDTLFNSSSFQLLSPLFQQSNHVPMSLQKATFIYINPFESFIANLLIYSAMKIHEDKNIITSHDIIPQLNIEMLLGFYNINLIQLTSWKATNIREFISNHIYLLQASIYTNPRYQPFESVPFYTFLLRYYITFGTDQYLSGTEQMFTDTEYGISDNTNDGNNDNVIGNNNIGDIPGKNINYYESRCPHQQKDQGVGSLILSISAQQQTYHNLTYSREKICQYYVQQFSNLAEHGYKSLSRYFNVHNDCAIFKPFPTLTLPLTAPPHPMLICDPDAIYEPRTLPNEHSSNGHNDDIDHYLSVITEEYLALVINLLLDPPCQKRTSKLLDSCLSGFKPI